MDKAPARAFSWLKAATRLYDDYVSIPILHLLTVIVKTNGSFAALLQTVASRCLPQVCWQPLTSLGRYRGESLAGMVGHANILPGAWMVMITYCWVHDWSC